MSAVCRPALSRGPTITLVFFMKSLWPGRQGKRCPRPLSEERSWAHASAGAGVLLLITLPLPLSGADIHRLLSGGGSPHTTYHVEAQH